MRFLIRRSGLRSVASVLGLWLLYTPSSSFAVFTEQRATWLSSAGVNAVSASLADIDNDGDLDLLFQGLDIASQKLFRNNTIGTGAHTFTDVTTTMWQTPPVSSMWSAAWADYDGDGKVDVFIGENNGGNSLGRLMRNTGTGFVDVSTSTGLNDNGFAQNVAWVDINNDHRLDMVIGMEGPKANQIYLQDATHHFAAVAPENGIQNPVSTKSYGMAIGDADGDGDMDIFISTCTGDGNGSIAKAYYKNTIVESGAAKTLAFTDVSNSNGTQNISQGYGAEFVDFDNDGKLDLWVVGSDTRPTKIYKNMGNGQFVDVDTISGHTLLSNTGSDLNGGKAIDYDNDGKLDLFFHDHLSGSSNVRLYHNDSDPNAANPADRWKFTDVTTTAGITNTGLGAYDSTWGDIDLDGDLDLINPTNTNTSERVYINDASTNGNHWLYVRLHGPDWNTTGIGASLYATLATGTTLRRDANTNAGTFNQSDLPVQFGLGASSTVDWLRIVWPDGAVEYLHNVSANQYLSVSYSAFVPGDFNADGIVDNSDYVVWRKYFGVPFTMDDYNTWRLNFGRTLSLGTGAAASVPEPASFVLVALGAMAFFPVRRG